MVMTHGRRLDATSLDRSQLIVRRQSVLNLPEGRPVLRRVRGLLFALLPILLILLTLSVAEAATPRVPVALTLSRTAYSAEVDPANLVFHPTTLSSAKHFLNAFSEYTESVEEEVDRLAKGLIAEKDYGSLSRIAKRARKLHASHYHQAMQAATSHLMDFQTQLGDQTDRRSTYILVDKSLFLIYLVDGRTGRAHAVFPIAHGVKSVVGPKQRKGDLRTPECTQGERTPLSTPFFASPLVPDDPFPGEGCITRGIGVCSRDPRYDYLSTGWTVMLHGTPDRGCIGTRASHGCIRLLPEHIQVLFDYVSEGTKIVILP